MGIRGGDWTIKGTNPPTFSPMLRFTRAFSQAPRALANYGFIGLGQMGQHMARHVYTQLSPDDHLYVHDVDPSAVDKFVRTVTDITPEHKLLLTPLSSVDEFASVPETQLDYIVTMVPEGAHVKAVVEQLVRAFQLAPADKARAATTICDSSTIDIATSREVADFVARELPHFSFVDSPVLGGVTGAQKGSLSFLVSKASHDDIAPGLALLWTKMGANIFPCGANHGSGLAAKLCNNYCYAVTNLAVADAYQLAKTFGLDLKSFAKLLSVSTGKSWASVENCPIKGAYPESYNLPADRDFEGGFVTKLTRKDLLLALESAQQNNRFLFLGDTSRKWYDLACNRDDIASRDFGVLYEWLGDLEQNQGQLVDSRTKQALESK